MRKNKHLLLVGIMLFCHSQFWRLPSTFAAAPNIETFVADDPDDGNELYSDDHSLTITFDINTNQAGTATKANIDGNFTFSQSLGNVYQGTLTDAKTLVITVSDITGEGGVQVGTTVTAKGTNTIGDENPHPDGENAQGTKTLTGDFIAESFFVY